MWQNVKNFLLDLFFPKFCLGCQREGTYLCEDCKSILEISSLHKTFKTEELDDLYFPLENRKPLLENLIKSFKSEPFIKDLSVPLSSLIIDHFQLLDKPPLFCKEKSNFILIPVPLDKKKLRWRGFNQAEEIAEQLSAFLGISLVKNVLTKKETFYCQNKEGIENKKVLLVDDTYSTGSTMKECAKALRVNGVKEVIGIIINRVNV